MPWIVSDITGVDTAGIRSASEAFRGGVVPAPSEALPAPENLYGELWAADSINGALVVAAVIFVIICLPRLMELAKYLFGGLLRWKETANLFASVRLSRDRNILFNACLMPLALLSSRYGLYRLDLMEGMAPWQVSLVTLGALLLAFGFRWVLVNYFSPRTLSDQWKVSRTNIYNGTIVATVLGLLTAGIATVAGAPDSSVRSVLYHESTILFVVILYRNFEILSWKGQRFKAFLYLCALELIPVILLVISGILF